MSQKLSTLKKKQEQLKAQIQALEARERLRERKRDTRRKILIGAYYLDKAKSDDKAWQRLVAELDTYLSRDVDRKLFDLPLNKQDASGPSEDHR